MGNDVFINLLRGIPLFSNLGPVLLARLSESLGTMKYDRGQTVIGEGQHCNNLFMVVSGKLEVFKSFDDNSEVILQTLGRGDFFGETYILDSARLPLGLRATEKSVVILLDRLSLISLLKASPEFPKSYLKQMTSMARESFSREEALIRALLKSGAALPERYSVNVPGQKPTADKQEVNEINETNVDEDADENNENNGVFFKKEYACPLCRTRFATLKPRQKYIVAESVDEDFCIHYKTINPIFYEVNVCPKCGYSFNSSTFGPVKAEVRGSLTRALGEMWKSTNYCGQRSIEEATGTFNLAIECQRLRGADDSSMGKLFLKRGWLYRYQNKKDPEHRDLESALKHLYKSYDSVTPENPKEEMNLMFLMGQLNLILGNEKEAVKWFILVTQHPQKSTYPYLVNRARDKWQETRRK